MKVPKHIIVNTGDQQEAVETIEKFFTSIRSSILKKIPPSQPHEEFEYKIRGLYMQPNTCLDDQVHMLYYKGRVVALVTETSSKIYYKGYDFFKNLEEIKVEKR